MTALHQSRAEIRSYKVNNLVQRVKSREYKVTSGEWNRKGRAHRTHRVSQDPRIISLVETEARDHTTYCTRHDSIYDSLLVSAIHQLDSVSELVILVLFEVESVIVEATWSTVTELRVDRSQHVLMSISRWCQLVAVLHVSTFSW